tara:strand:+ start:122 stop:454 length:333 start_codon:yes stop_codon:yes gene_type:complete
MRYYKQRIFTNDSPAYKKYLKERGKQSIRQYNTPKLQIPDSDDIRNLNVIEHVWTTGDRYFKLAEKFYGDPEMWWVIALFNQKPTEFDYKLGDVVYIPTPLERTLFYLGY